MQQRNDGTLNFYLLKCLVALVDYSHVSRAADAMEISQPAMSRAMQQLRQLIGDPVLVKGGSGLIPTAKALQIRDFAERIIKEMDDLVGNAVAFNPSMTKFVFRIIATDYLQCVFLDRVVERLASSFPNISLVVRHPVNPAHLGQILEAGEVDFCVGMLPPTMRDLRHRLLFRDEVACIASKGHWAVGKELAPAEFASLDHVVITPTVHSFADSADNALSAIGLSRNRRFVTPNYLAVPYFLESSGMAALVPSSLARRFHEHFSLTEIDIPVAIPPYDVFLYWHDRIHHHPAHLWFRDQVFRCVDEVMPANRRIVNHR